ncbi:hypothetical protein NKH34_25060 [Mesorhizobium sp. M1148]|uniref:hypothetical protein n=1 Tax=unclassified Mesorhizobium TaxID=325217 RepID=UPI003339A66D
MAIYHDGTVAVQKHSVAVTGNGTLWSHLPGGLFTYRGLAVPIASIESDTSLTLAYAWPGADAGSDYAISYRPVQPQLDPGIAQIVEALEALAAR